MASNGSDDQVLIEENQYVRTLTLNRPRQLNALSHRMISLLLKAFADFKEDPTVKLVILKGIGRAFCAGGDVAAVAHSITEGHWGLGAAFFRDEFTLNYIMATYRKPQVSILTGIVMGGGAGVSIHGKFRVVTENSVFAMPETALGLFPDIGASYFLSRLPGFFGEYVGLTGVRLDAAEMLACGLATHFVSSAKLPLLEEALMKVDTTDPSVISSIIDRFSQKVHVKAKSAYNRLDIIDRCFSKRTIEDIKSAIELEAIKGAEEWISAAIESLNKASPFSLKLSLRSIREGRLQGIDQCLIREFRMVCHVLKSEVSRDFFEGCRAILVDKDKNPKWEPSKLELITDEMVDRYFTRVDDEGWEDLNLTSIQRNSKL
ncbi:3-hydroxyisobutyryl-CoA hydrolase 1 [Acorus calamus]|uniref:3-hydroxyisobutyryl-CoA hydrolase n=1 Tax=Acorus calamus TaxID=4465 RepID=A0AAV9FIB1_ACOCL|nr:3-hydroxyisobutyryl-CoA hydrolase 1 [Acorus calamus]KAK1325459.1 3-hydroxyisobutyryl-CoA hydrolase 1 [Acorus calamus]